jgi:hypothetical protein
MTTIDCPVCHGKVRAVDGVIESHRWHVCAIAGEPCHDFWEFLEMRKAAANLICSASGKPVGFDPWGIPYEWLRENGP